MCHSFQNSENMKTFNAKVRDRFTEDSAIAFRNIFTLDLLFKAQYFFSFRSCYGSMQLGVSFGRDAKHEASVDLLHLHTCFVDTHHLPGETIIFHISQGSSTWGNLKILKVVFP